jgi:glycosyltransferase involved in cell wall biosynthesis
MMSNRSNGPVWVAFFPMHPVDDRATGTFCVLPATRAADRGVQGDLFPPSSPELYEFFYRRKTRGWRIRAGIYWYLIVLPRRLVQLLRARKHDVIFVQRSMFRWRSPPAMEWLARRLTGLPIAYHLDDGIWLAARQRWSEDRCRLATTVVTGNKVIAEFAEAVGTPVAPIEYAVDAAAYPVKQHENRSPAIIGYTGIAPEEHLTPIAEPLLEVCETTGARVKVVGGLRRPQLGGLDPHLDWQPWNHDDEYSWAADFDIGVMPLSDTALHRTKEPLKVKEYMAAGLPIVLSPVGHNTSVVSDGEQGFFAASPEEWRQSLERLVNDAELRAVMGRSGRELILERYDLPRLLDELAELFHRLAAEPGPPRQGVGT